MFKLSDATTIIDAALAEARTRSLAPLAVAVLDAAGYPRSAILPRTYRNPPARPLRERPAPAPAQ